MQWLIKDTHQTINSLAPKIEKKKKKKKKNTGGEEC